MSQPHSGRVDPGKRRTEKGPLAVTRQGQAWRHPGDLLLVFTNRTDLHAASLRQE